MKGFSARLSVMSKLSALCEAPQPSRRAVVTFIDREEQVLSALVLSRSLSEIRIQARRIARYRQDAISDLSACLLRRTGWELQHASDPRIGTSVTERVNAKG